MEPALNPTQIAAELDLPIKRGDGAKTLTEEQVLDAAVKKYWLRNATIQIKAAS